MCLLINKSFAVTVVPASSHHCTACVPVCTEALVYFVHFNVTVLAEHTRLYLVIMRNTAFCCRPVIVISVYLLRSHSIILASCKHGCKPKPGCKPGFRPGLHPGFRQVRAGLRPAFDMLSTAFDIFLSKTWSRTCCINLDMSRLMQQVRLFVRVVDKWNVEKKPVSSQPTNLLKLDFRYVFYYSCLS